MTSHFKTATIVVISKPNKELYNTPKAFQYIVLLKTTGKLIEKVISNHLQFYIISNSFLCHKLYLAISPSFLQQFSWS